MYMCLMTQWLGKTIRALRTRLNAMFSKSFLLGEVVSQVESLKIIPPILKPYGNVVVLCDVYNNHTPPDGEGGAA